jgi:hypothetical protein
MTQLQRHNHETMYCTPPLRITVHTYVHMYLALRSNLSAVPSQFVAPGTCKRLSAIKSQPVRDKPHPCTCETVESQGRKALNQQPALLPPSGCFLFLSSQSVSTFLCLGTQTRLKQSWRLLVPPRSPLTAATLRLLCAGKSSASLFIGGL